MICHGMGGFTTIHHNKIHDITASILTEVCHDVATESPLQPHSGKNVAAHTPNTDSHQDERTQNVHVNV